MFPSGQSLLRVRKGNGVAGLQSQIHPRLMLFLVTSSSLVFLSSKMRMISREAYGVEAKQRNQV